MNSYEIFCRLLTNVLAITLFYLFKKIAESNTFESVQDRSSVGPDLGPTVCKGNEWTPLAGKL